MSSDQIYLDHSAATPLDPVVRAAMEPYFSELFFNPSSPYVPALAVRRDYEAAKDAIGHAIGAKGDELIITAGATESINLAVRATTGHVIVPAIEHHAVLAAARLHDYTITPVSSKGLVTVESISAAIRPDTQLVSVALANNELGTVQPLRAIAAVIAAERNRRLARGDTTPIYLHSDASQGVGQLDINVARLGVDLLTLNAGKAYGPKQIGALWAARHVRLEPLVVGGGQERGLRSGTENVAATIGFAKAMELAAARRKSEVARLSELRDGLQKKLLDAFPDAVISGHTKHRLAGHLHISFPGLDAERLIFGLEAKNVLIGTGSACAANKGTRSHVLEAIGLSPEVADGSLRITLGHLSTFENTDRAAQCIIDVVTAEKERLATP